jgi:hypothetical protein
MKDDLNYSPSDCLSNFPLQANSSHEDKVRDAAQKYHGLRRRLASESCLTSVNNEVNDPSCTNPEIKALRVLLSNLDAAVAEMYSIDSKIFGLGFTIAHLPAYEEEDVPSSLSELLNDGIPFYGSEVEALDFGSQWEAAFGRGKRLPWRYCWPDAVRDGVLARLLALNAERYAEEVAMGLHSKAGKAAAKASKAGGTAGAKRRGRPPKTTQAGETEPIRDEQIRLRL